jgi:hypothetical protein
MVIITIETSTTYSIRTMHYQAQEINWAFVMKCMANDKANYSIRVLELNK